MVLGATEEDAVGQGRPRQVRRRFAEPCSDIEGYSARSRCARLSLELRLRELQEPTPDSQRTLQ